MSKMKIRLTSTTLGTLSTRGGEKRVWRRPREPERPVSERELRDRHHFIIIIATFICEFDNFGSPAPPFMLSVCV